MKRHAFRGYGDASACLKLRTPVIRRDRSKSDQILCPGMLEEIGSDRGDWSRTEDSRVADRPGVRPLEVSK